MHVPLELDEGQFKRGMIVVYVLTLFVQIIDGTVINVAIPTLADAFGVTDTVVDRAIIAYLVSLAVFIPASGWLANRFGARRVFMSSLTLFTVASMLCGLSQSLAQLVGFRLLQGVGAGVMGPVGAALLYRAFPQNERARAATAVIGVAVIAPATGPVLGGFLIETLNWRWIFYVNVPLGLIAFALAYALVQDFGGDEKRRFDIAGFALSGAGLGATLFAVTIAREEGWTSPIVVGPLLVGLASLIALPFVERRQQHPLLNFGLFRAPIYRAIQIVAFPTYLAFFAVIFLMPLYLQSFRGFDGFETGLAVFPQAIGVMISSQIAGRRLYSRIGPRRLMFAGIFLAMLVGFVITTIDQDTSLWTVRLMMFSRGLALGLAFVAIQTAVYAQTSVADTADATALFTANRQSGPAFGVALAVTVLTTVGGSDANPDLGGYQAAMLVSALMFVPALIATWWVRDEDAAATLLRA